MTLFECIINRGLENITNEVDTVWGRSISSPLTESKADEQKLIDFAGEDLAKRFFVLKPKLKSPENDLYYWLKKDLNDFEQFINDTENKKSKTQQKKSISDGAKLVGENEYWKVYHITTFEASQKYGRDSKWCITGVDGYGDRYWKAYTDEGIQFYFYITKGDYNRRGKDSKFAIAVYPNGRYEIYNQQDIRVSDIPCAPKIEDIPYNPLKVVNEFTYNTSEGLPENIDRKSIKTITVIDGGNHKISPRAFYGCTSLQSITIPDSINGIGDTAFYGCASLQSITLPENMRIIHDSTFYNCVSLRNVTIPNGVTEIGAKAFNGCAFTEITIPESVKYIEELAFNFCTSLTTVNLNEGLLCVGDGAFGTCTDLTEITIPNSVKTIGPYAFEHCTSLTKVTLNESLESIEDDAFSDCWNLTEITIPGSVISIGKYAFYNCAFLTTVKLTEGLETIGEGAFFYCNALREITIPNSVTRIDNDAFSRCSSLKMITIPKSVRHIGDDAFYNCENLTLRCYSGSYAERYAKENNIPYKYIAN
jgi:hypothetical protein